LAVGLLLLVNTTSSVEDVHDPLDIVHLNVALLPAVIPVTPDVFEEELVMDAVPLTTLHAPVPLDGEFPAKVKLALLHCDISLPAEDTVGDASTVMDVDDDDELQLFPSVTVNK
tara:strand:+ start:51 stop:392 length:342 start_codon:yes stop_codon:yes gene_type:complete